MQYIIPMFCFCFVSNVHYLFLNFQFRAETMKQLLDFTLEWLLSNKIEIKSYKSDFTLIVKSSWEFFSCLHKNIKKENLN